MGNKLQQMAKNDKSGMYINRMGLSDPAMDVTIILKHLKKNFIDKT